MRGVINIVAWMSTVNQTAGHVLGCSKKAAPDGKHGCFPVTCRPALQLSQLPVSITSAVCCSMSLAPARLADTLAPHARHSWAHSTLMSMLLCSIIVCIQHSKVLLFRDCALKHDLQSFPHS